MDRPRRRELRRVPARSGGRLRQSDKGRDVFACRGIGSPEHDHPGPVAASPDRQRRRAPGVENRDAAVLTGDAQARGQRLQDGHSDVGRVRARPRTNSRHLGSGGLPQRRSLRREGGQPIIPIRDNFFEPPVLFAQCVVAPIAQREAGLDLCPATSLPEVSPTWPPRGPAATVAKGAFAGMPLEEVVTNRLLARPRPGWPSPRR